MMNVAEHFREAMRQGGLDYAGPIHADGQLHRIKVEGDKARNSWYVMHAGSPCAGAFGCWKRGVNETWCEKRDRKYDDAEWRSIRANWQQANEERARAEAEQQAEARAKAARILAASSLPAVDHPYLAAKGIQSLGDIREHEGRLVVPLRDANGELHSLQTISSDGSKRFLTGGKVAGTFCTIPGPDTGPLVICEGLATGASIHEATGRAVVCAMNCDNLMAVAQAMRRQWTSREIIIAADNDAFTKDKDGNPQNPGLTKATEAAKAIGAKLAIPHFRDTAAESSDFNDLHQLEGIEQVKAQIESSTQPKETDPECFARLAKMSNADYDRNRKSEATRLGIRVETLDKEVHALRRDAANEDKVSSAEPWDSPVDGAELLDQIAATFERFCVLPPHASEVLAAWVLQTYCYQMFDFAGVIAVWSPEPSCGKGRVLDVTEALAMNPFRSANTSAAVLYHQVSKGDLTVLIDELDSQSEEQVGAISNILKSGFQSNGTAHRMAEVNGQQEVVEFSTYSPKMTALIGMDCLDKATRSRAISVRMTRKPRESRIEKFRRFDGTDIRRKCLRWVKDNTEAIQAVGAMTLDECATDRQEDVWEPLVTIARVAGGGWESIIRDAASHLSGSVNEAASETVAHQLLEAIKFYFDTHHVSKVGTKQLIAALTESGDFSDCNRGRGLTPAFLAKQLRPYGISPRSVRDGDDSFKGYYLEHFEDAFSSYLPDSGIPKRHTVTTPINIDQNAVFENVTQSSCDVSENTISTNAGAGCDVVTAQKQETAPEDADPPILRRDDLLEELA